MIKKSTETIKRLADSGKIKRIKMGVTQQSPVLIEKESLITYLESLK